MSNENTQILRRKPRLTRLDPWSAGAVLIAAIVLMPIGAVLWIAATPAENIWPHLLATVLPRYLSTTLTLMAGVSLLTAAVGTGAADRPCRPAGL